MTGNDAATIISAISSLIAAIGSAVAVVMTAINRTSIERVHKDTNSMKDQLVKQTGEQKYAEGLLDGKASNGNGNSNDPPAPPAICQGC